MQQGNRAAAQTSPALLIAKLLEPVSNGLVRPGRYAAALPKQCRAPPTEPLLNASVMQ